MTRPDFTVWVQRVRAQTELRLAHFLPDENTVPTTLHRAMRYAVLDGGKRIRAMLVEAAAQLGEADETALTQAVSAVEMIHAYSLIHDDLPAMDNDALRRGKPSCHVAFGEAEALLAGNALQALAFEIMCSENTLPSTQRLRSCRILAYASGSMGMIGGQAVDLHQVGQQPTQTQLTAMHNMKTGMLISASVQLGYLSCHNPDASVETALQQYSAAVGLAFQVIDDVLDHEADSTILGKTAGKDAADNKPTFVSLLGIEQARQYARELHQTALSALSDFDHRADALRFVADVIIERKY